MAIIAGEIFRICLYPKFVWKWIVRTIETRRGEQSDITQKEANYLYENDEASIGKSMSVMFIFLLTILFYSPIMPGITVLGIIGSSILYWVLKIVILKRNVIMRQIDWKLVINTSRILKIGIFTNALTNLIFLSSLFSFASPPSIITLIVSITFCCLPVRSFLIKRFVSPVDRAKDDKTYYDYSNGFQHYDLCNPVTAEKALQRLQHNTTKEHINKYTKLVGHAPLWDEDISLYSSYETPQLESSKTADKPAGGVKL